MPTTSSANVENRIVRMEFDNKEFESNMKKTTNSLDKLKEALKLQTGKNAFDELESSVKKVDLKPILRGIDQLNDQFSFVRRNVRRVVDDIAGDILRTANKISGFVTTNVIQGGYQRATDIEQARFQLMGMVKDEKEVSAIMGQVKESVADTAYGMDQAALAASQLASSGIKAGDQMKKALGGIAGVTATVNGNYEEISRIVTKVMAQGKVGGDELMQFSTRGLNMRQVVADWLKNVKNDAAAASEVLDGAQISAETFVSAIYDTYAQHSKDADNTVKGAFANLKAALKQIGQPFYEGLIVEKGPVNKLLKSVKQVVKDAKVLILDSEKYAKDGESVLDHWNRIIPNVINKFTKFFTAFGVAKYITPWIDGFHTLIDVIDVVSDRIIIFMKAFDEGAKGFPATMSSIFNFIGNIYKGIIGIFDGFNQLDGTVAVLRTIRNVFEALYTVITPIAQAFKDTYVNFTVLSNLEGLSSFQMIGQVIANIAKALESFSAKLALSGSSMYRVKEIAKGFISVGQLVWYVIEKAAALINFLWPYLEKVGSVILLVATRVAQLVRIVNTWIIQNDVLSVATNGVVTVFNAFWGVLTSLGTVIQNFINKLIKIIDPYGIIQLCVTEVIDTFSKWSSGLDAAGETTNAVTWVFNAFAAVLGWVKTALDNLDTVLTPVASALEWVSKLLWTVVINISNAIQTLFSSSTGGGITSIGQVITNIFTAIGNVANWVINAIEYLLNFILSDKVTKILSKILDVIMMIYWSKGWEYLNGIVGKVKSILDPLNTQVKSFATNAIKLSIALLIIAGTIVILKDVPWQDALRVLMYLAVIAVFLKIVVDKFQAISNDAMAKAATETQKTIESASDVLKKATAQAKATIASATMITSIATAVVLIAIAYKTITKATEGLSQGEMWTRVGILVTLLAAITAVTVTIIQLVKNQEIPQAKFRTILAIFGGLALLIKMAIAGFKDIAGIKNDSDSAGIVGAIVAIAVIFVAIGVLVAAVADMDVKKDSIGVIASVASILFTVSKAVKSFAELELLDWGKGLFSVIALLAVITLLMKTLNDGAQKLQEGGPEAKKTWKTVFKNYLAVVVGLGLLLGELYLLSKMPAGNILMAIALFASIAIVLTGMMWALSKIATNTKQVDDIIKLLKALCTVMLSVSAVIWVISSLVELVLTAAAASGDAKMISGLLWDVVLAITAFVAVVGGLAAALGLLSVALGPAFLAGVQALGVFFLMIAGTAFLLALSIERLAEALREFATALTITQAAFGGNLEKIRKAAINLGSAAAEGISVFIVKSLELIAELAPRIRVALVKICTELADFLGDSWNGMWFGLGQLLGAPIGAGASALWGILSGFLEALNDEEAIAEVNRNAVELIIALINGFNIAISTHQDELAQVIDDFLDTIGNFIEEKGPSLISRFAYLGLQIGGAIFDTVINTLNEVFGLDLKTIGTMSERKALEAELSDPDSFHDLLQKRDEAIKIETLYGGGSRLTGSYKKVGEFAAKYGLRYEKQVKNAMSSWMLTQDFKDYLNRTGHTRADFTDDIYGLSLFVEYMQMKEETVHRLKDQYDAAVEEGLDPTSERKAYQTALDALNTLRNAMGIHSPSTETTEMGENLGEGLVQGITNSAPSVEDAAKNLGSSIIGWFKDGITKVGVQKADDALGLGGALTKMFEEGANPLEIINKVIGETTSQSGIQLDAGSIFSGIGLGKSLDANTITESVNNAVSAATGASAPPNVEVPVSADMSQYDAQMAGLTDSTGSFDMSSVSGLNNLGNVSGIDGMPSDISSMSSDMSDMSDASAATTSNTASLAGITSDGISTIVSEIRTLDQDVVSAITGGTSTIGKSANIAASGVTSIDDSTKIQNEYTKDIAANSEEQTEDNKETKSAWKKVDLQPIEKNQRKILKASSNSRVEIERFIGKASDADDRKERIAIADQITDEVANASWIDDEEQRKKYLSERSDERTAYQLKDELRLADAAIDIQKTNKETAKQLEEQKKVDAFSKIENVVGKYIKENNLTKEAQSVLWTRVGNWLKKNNDLFYELSILRSDKATNEQIRNALMYFEENGINIANAYGKDDENYRKTAEALSNQLPNYLDAIYNGQVVANNLAEEQPKNTKSWIRQGVNKLVGAVTGIDSITFDKKYEEYLDKLGITTTRHLASIDNNLGKLPKYAAKEEETANENLETNKKTGNHIVKIRDWVYDQSLKNTDTQKFSKSLRYIYNNDNEWTKKYGYRDANNIVHTGSSGMYMSKEDSFLQLIKTGKEVTDTLKPLAGRTIEEVFKELQEQQVKNAVYNSDFKLFDPIAVVTGLGSALFQPLTSKIVDAATKSTDSKSTTVSATSAVVNMDKVSTVNTTSTGTANVATTSADISGKVMNSEEAKKTVSASGVDYSASINAIKTEVADINTRLNDIYTRLEKTNVVMDTGELVGAIGPEMDAYLGNQMAMVGRGVS